MCSGGSNPLANVMNKWRETIEMFEDAIVKLQDERSEHSEWVDIGNGIKELAWVLHERKGMVELVNIKRKEAGLSPVSEKDFIALVEARALGHFDYTRNLSVGCSYLSIGRNPRNVEKEF